MGGIILGGPGGPGNGRGPLPGPRINPDECPIMECTKCGHDTFVEVIHLRAVSGLQVPNPEGAHIVQKVIVCGMCGLPVDIPLSKKWAWLTPDTREQARKDKLKHLQENGNG